MFHFVGLYWRLTGCSITALYSTDMIEAPDTLIYIGPVSKHRGLADEREKLMDLMNWGQSG
jgi:hypothetical protein